MCLDPSRFRYTYFRILLSHCVPMPMPMCTVCTHTFSFASSARVQAPGAHTRVGKSSPDAWCPHGLVVAPPLVAVLSFVNDYEYPRALALPPEARPPLYPRPPWIARSVIRSLCATYFCKRQWEMRAAWADSPRPAAFSGRGATGHRRRIDSEGPSIAELYSVVV